jgi:hypothetical protein
LKNGASSFISNNTDSPAEPKDALIKLASTDPFLSPGAHKMLSTFNTPPAIPPQQAFVKLKF